MEIDKIAIVTGLGIDKISGENTILLTAQIVNPSTFKKGNGGQQNKPFIVTTARGKDMSDAVRNFAKDSPRRFFFPHTTVIVIGDEMARAGVRPILDFFERDPQFRRTSWMLVTPKTANEILKTSMDLEKIGAIGIEGMIREFSRSSATRAVQRKNFMVDLASKSRSAIASKLNLVDEEAIVKRKLQEANGTEEESDQEKSGGERKQIRLEGAALFQKDKLAGYLNAAESRGLLWVLGDVQGGEVVVPCSGDAENYISFSVLGSKTTIKPKYEGEKLKINLEIEEEGAISDVGCANLDLTKPETLVKLEKLKAKDIEERILQTVHKAQELKADVVGFGDAFYRKNPKKWKNFEKNWFDEYFPKVEVSMQVTCKLRRVGMTSKAVELGQ